MVYTVCKAKNDFARNEEHPIYNPDNWEVVDHVKCRKNATKETWEKAFYPVYQRLHEKYKDERYRLWNFKGTIERIENDRTRTDRLSI